MTALRSHPTRLIIGGRVVELGHASPTPIIAPTLKSRNAKAGVLSLRGGYLKCRVSPRRATHLSLASPRESKQREGDPTVCVPTLALRATCGAHSRWGLRKLARWAQTARSPFSSVCCAPRRSQKGVGNRGRHCLFKQGASGAGCLNMQTLVGRINNSPSTQAQTEPLPAGILPALKHR
jgi:hypothetical protein